MLNQLDNNFQLVILLLLFLLLELLYLKLNLSRLLNMQALLFLEKLIQLDSKILHLNFYLEMLRLSECKPFQQYKVFNLLMQQLQLLL